jgi:hypothetical protein
MPGGVGGMGQAGECIGGGGGGGSSDASAQSGQSGSSAGGGSAGSGATGSASGGSGGTTGTGGAGSVGEFPGESAEARAERLGRELEESLGGFDETLQEEQREIASVGRSTEGFDTGAGEESGSGGLIGLGSQGGGMSGLPGGQGSAGGNAIPEIEGLSQEEIAERTPEDVPTMVDDDIIARQLREAALTEDDPELRERLWDEYRKYKGL